jgi:hypothetical protein
MLTVESLNHRLSMYLELIGCLARRPQRAEILLAFLNECSGKALALQLSSEGIGIHTGHLRSVGSLLHTTASASNSKSLAL